MEPLTRVRLMNGVQAFIWSVLGFLFLTGALLEPQWVRLMGIAVAGGFFLRGLGAGGMALFTPGTRGSLVAAVIYLLSAWPMGVGLLVYAFLTQSNTLEALLMGTLGVLFLFQAFRGQQALADLAGLLRGRVPAGAAAAMEAAHASEPTGPPRLLLLWGAPWPEVEVVDKEKLEKALKAGEIGLYTVGESTRYVGIPMASIPEGRAFRDLPREAVIRDPGTSQAFRNAGLRAAPGRAFVLHDPTVVTEVIL